MPASAPSVSQKKYCIVPSKLPRQTRVYNEENGVWLNQTKNYTVHGNWTRTVTKSVTIQGIGQPVDTLISPDGQFFYVCTGYFVSSEAFSGQTCSTRRNDCPAQIGHLTYFKRNPFDGSLFWAGKTRYDNKPLLLIL